MRSMISPVRRRQFEDVRESVQAWAADEAGVVAVALGGSWARGEPRMDSDIDIVVLTEVVNRYVEHDDWLTQALRAPAVLIRTETWGALVERRVRLLSGLEVEFGFAAPSWADTDPVDDGTRKVISDGCEIWFDPARHLARMVKAVVW